MVKRFHRPLGAAIRCHQHDQWTSVLPRVLFRIRAAWKEDLKTTSAQLVYALKKILYLHPPKHELLNHLLIKSLNQPYYLVDSTKQCGFD